MTEIRFYISEYLWYKKQYEELYDISVHLEPFFLTTGIGGSPCLCGVCSRKRKRAALWLMDKKNKGNYTTIKHNPQK